MKKISFFLFFFLASIAFSYSQITIGTGTTTSFVPYSTSYEYSYGQSIYLKSEIGTGAGYISSIQWYFTGLSSIPNSNLIDVYLGNTTKQNFLSNKDFFPSDQLTKVYSGTITTNASPGWKTIVFDQPFPYDGVSNLVVAVDENRPGLDPIPNDGGVTPVNAFNCTATSNYRSVYALSKPLSSSNDPVINIDPRNPLNSNLTVSFGYKPLIPNIILGLPLSCPAPTGIIVQNIGTTTATLTWDTPTNTPTNGSEYYLSQINNPPTDSSTPTGKIATGNTINLNNLNFGTTYYAWIRNNCGNGDIGKWSSVATFTTNCDHIIGSYYQNFDLTTLPNLPNCWTKIINAVSPGTVSPSANIKTVNVNGYYSSSPNSLQMSNANSSANTTGDYFIMAVSPYLTDLSGGNHKLSFSYKATKAGGVIEVGTLSTNDNSGQFTLIKGNILPTTSFQTVSVDFANYHGGDNYIAIRLGTASASQIFVYVDDIVWVANSTCPDVSSVNSTASGTDATISWSEAGSEDSWEIAYTNDPTIVNPSLLTSYPTNTSGIYSISNLNPNMQYKAWVRSVCGTTKGNWVGPTAFQTDCATLSTFTEGFDEMIDGSLPICWNSILRGPGLAFGNTGAQINTLSTSFATSPPNELFIGNGQSSGSYDVILVTPKLNTLVSGTYRLRFHAKGFSDPTTTFNLDIGTLDTKDANATFTLVKSIQATRAQQEFVIDNFIVTTNNYVGIKLNSSIPMATGFIIDDIIWEPKPLCPDITNISVDRVTENTVSISWTQNGNEASWEVIYGKTNNVNDPNNILVQVPATSGPQAVLTNLDNSSQYYIWVRSSCGTNKGRWIGPITATTECPAVATFSQDFNSVAVPNLPTCWSKILRGGSSLSDFATIQTSNGSVRLDAQGSTPDAQIILVSPNISTLADAANYRLKFNFKTTENVTLEIGTLSGNIANSTYTPSYTLIITSNTPTNQIIQFSNFNYNGVDNHIGIRLLGSSDLIFPNIVLDNIVWEKIPTCLEPSNIVVNSTTENTAILSWTKGSTELNWQISVNPFNATTPSEDANNLVNANSNTNFVLTNLQNSTNYKIWVRANCGNGVFSYWSTVPATFNTQCGISNIPYKQNFEETQVPNLPICTTSNNLGSGNNWDVYQYIGNPNYGFTSQTLRLFTNNDNDGNAWFFTGGVNLQTGTNYTITYRYGSNNNQTFKDLHVKFGSDSTPDTMTNTLADYGPLVITSATTESINFTVPLTGVYYFGFNGVNRGITGSHISISSSILIDDINVDLKLSTDQFDISKLSYYPNPVSNILNISYINNINNITVYNLLGQEILNKKVSGTDSINQVDMSGLNTGTYMVRITSDNTSKVIKVIKQ